MIENKNLISNSNEIQIRPKIATIDNLVIAPIIGINILPVPWLAKYNVLPNATTVQHYMGPNFFLWPL